MLGGGGGAKRPGGRCPGGKSPGGKCPRTRQRHRGTDRLIPVHPQKHLFCGV